MKLIIEHTTAWHYDHPVLTSTQYLRLTPRSNTRQQVLNWQVDMPGRATHGTDPYGNMQHVLTLDSPGATIHVTARGSVELHPDVIEENDGINPLVFLRTTPLTRADGPLLDFADAFRSERPTREALRALMLAIEGHVAYTQGTTDAATTAAEAFTRRSGVCQDHTHIFLACARAIGVPARYVSGYVHVEGRSHIASHAWAEAWLGEHWLTFDISNKLDHPTTHLKLAIGMDYLDACPVRGVRYGGGIERMSAQALVDLAQQGGQ